MTTSSNQEDHGRAAEWPSQLPARGWWDIAMRLWRSFGDDRVMMIAGGVTFYLLLALFPALTVFVSAYGFFSDPATVARHVEILAGVVPAEGLQIISERLESLATQDSGALGFGIVIGLLAAFWSANNGIKSIFEALNVAYGETEKRSFIRLNLQALAFTIGAMLTAVVLVAAVGVVPAVLGFLQLGNLPEILLSAIRWPILLLFVAFGTSLLYRYGASREHAKWRWITWGSAFTTIVWIAASAGFSFYLQSFANYEATYGSLGAAIGFMMWTWVSVIILILGAMINAEMEHQTAQDSTVGAERPMGRRGATVADTLGETSND